ncbi:alanine racemase [Agrobacterium tumefaciens]|uniref:alanine racemase n=1 Tax=Agrobacterium tumefaciens TaxID=358 RepID=UPI00287CC824|nr:alanine racemase [Agrobacterium tumefaciens]MDS7595033.1 alanine racemase [Agrobacterium tumefaciens]
MSSAVLACSDPDLASRFPGFDELVEPRVVVDLPTLHRNLKAMAEIVGEGAELHPHVKTHKSLTIAKAQRDQGAKGFTVARAHEARMLLEAGLDPITIAYPLISPETIAALLTLAGDPRRLRFIADSETGVAALTAAGQKLGFRVQVFVKVDVGLHRCGVDPKADAGLQLATAIDRDPHLSFAGLLSHAGHAYGAAGRDAIRAVAAEELSLLAEFRSRVEKSGIVVPRVSIGSTPTLLANAGFEGVDEVRPGNYAFLDLTAVRLGIASRADVALGVAARIVSANEHYAIANVGSKTLSSDLGAHGTSATSSYGEAWISGEKSPLPVLKLSEEHAFVSYSGKRPANGTPILIFPNHSCPVANLSGGMLGLGDDQFGAQEIPVEGIRAQRPS